MRSQLPFGWVCFSNHGFKRERMRQKNGSQLPFGWVCFSNECSSSAEGRSLRVSIAFRLGLFL